MKRSINKHHSSIKKYINNKNLKNTGENLNLMMEKTNRIQ